jgi:hypothetical protein
MTRMIRVPPKGALGHYSLLRLVSSGRSESISSVVIQRKADCYYPNLKT